MEIKNKLVYYCEFCKKHNLSSYAIRQHELHCTLNPNRECRVCEHSGIYKFRIGKKFTQETLERMRIIIKCPSCMLAVIRKWIRKNGKTYSDFDVQFDLAEETKRYWEAKYQERPEI